MWRIAGLLVMSACDVVFGLEPRPLDAGADAVLDAALDAPPDAPKCPALYGPVAGMPNVYRVMDTFDTWTTAESNCVSHSAGITHLVVPTQTQHLVALRSIPGLGRSWVGMGRDVGGSLDQFRTLTNVPVPRSSPLWETGEPSDTSGNDRVVELVDAGTMRLNDTNEAMLHRYVCECDFLPITPFQ